MYAWQAAALECGEDGGNLVYCEATLLSWDVTHIHECVNSWQFLHACLRMQQFVGARANVDRHQMKDIVPCRCMQVRPPQAASRWWRRCSCCASSWPHATSAAAVFEASRSANKAPLFAIVHVAVGFNLCPAPHHGCCCALTRPKDGSCQSSAGFKTSYPACVLLCPHAGVEACAVHPALHQRGGREGGPPGRRAELHGCALQGLSWQGREHHAPAARVRVLA